MEDSYVLLYYPYQSLFSLKLEFVGQIYKQTFNHSFKFLYFIWMINCLQQLDNIKILFNKAYKTRIGYIVYFRQLVIYWDMNCINYKLTTLLKLMFINWVLSGGLQSQNVPTCVCELWGLKPGLGRVFTHVYYTSVKYIITRHGLTKFKSV